MIHILIKQDAFLCDRFLKQLLDKVSPKAERDFNFDRLSAKEHKLDQMIGIYRTAPMMADTRTLIIEDFDKLKKDDLAKFGTVLKTPNDDCHLILIAEKLDKRTSFYKSLSKKAKVQEFKKPYPNQVPQFLQDEVSKMGLKLAPGCAQMLVEAGGTDLMSLLQEVEKLSIYVAPKKEIQKNDVKALVSGGILENIFDLTTAMGEKDYARAHGLYLRFLEQGEPLIKTVSLAIGHFRKLLLTVDAKATRSSEPLASLLGVHPFFAKDYEKQARRFTPKSLKRIYSDLMKLSVDLRSVKAAPETLFENFLQKACL